MHYQPGTGPQFDLTGWRITTGATACTLNCVLKPDSYIVIDSLALAFHALGAGRLRINPDSGLICLYQPDSICESLSYPRTMTGYGRAPPLPHGGSVALEQAVCLTR